jgi:processing peptidase subunit alpha
LFVVHLSPPDRVAAITRSALEQYRRANFVGPRMVLAATGFPHEQLVALAQRHFASVPAAPSSAVFTFPLSQYVGGMVKEPEFEAPPGMPDVKYVAMAFRGPFSWHSPQVLPACVLQTLLGGGSSFSAGGPGKGMYSRLYSRVLAKSAQYESAQVLLHIYEDDALFGVTGSAPADAIHALSIDLLNELRELLRFYVSPAELSRAKNMLKSTLTMNLELRAVRLEDVARQLLTFGKREDPAETCAKIDRVTEHDLARLVAGVLQSQPAVAVLGDAPRAMTPAAIRAYVVGQ